VPSFLVESYLVEEPGAVAEALTRAQRVAALGEGVSYLRTTLVPADEACLHLFEAPSADALSEATRRAELDHLRIVEAVEAQEPPK
jgi:hypothetical protein